MNFNVLYYVPPDFPSANLAPFREICKIVATLRGVTSRQGARVPGTPLTIRLLYMLNGARIEFDYHGELAYINFCCLEKLFADDIYELVEQYYQTYGLGKPWKPTDERWIHLIPVAGAMPDPDHSVLAQGLTIAFYWAACIQRQIRSESN